MTSLHAAAKNCSPTNIEILEYLIIKIKQRVKNSLEHQDLLRKYE